MNSRRDTKHYAKLGVEPSIKISPKNLLHDVTNPYSNQYDKIVVNPMTKLSPNTNNQYSKNDITFTKAVVPNLGKCEKTGMWKNKEQINECQNCVAKSSSEYPYFYCDGSCLSKYEFRGGSCSLNSLVAKNKQQCNKPCKQFNSPSLNNDCQDDFDCEENEKCDKDGTCVPFYSQKNFKNANIKPSDTNIFNVLKICSTSKDIKNCVDDLNTLNCQDIVDLVKKNIDDSHKNGSYKSERENIIKIFNKIKKNTEIEDREYNKLVSTIENINCVIDEINHQYQLDDIERIKPINITEQKAHYISRLLDTDKMKNMFDLGSMLGNNNCKIYLFTSIIFFVIIIMLLIFYRRNGKSLKI